MGPPHTFARKIDWAGLGGPQCVGHASGGTVRGRAARGPRCLSANELWRLHHCRGGGRACVHAFARDRRSFGLEHALQESTGAGTGSDLYFLIARPRLLPAVCVDVNGLSMPGRLGRYGEASRRSSPCSACSCRRPSHDCLQRGLQDVIERHDRELHAGPVVRTRRLVLPARSSRGRQWHTAPGARARRVATFEPVAPRASQRR